MTGKPGPPSGEPAADTVRSLRIASLPQLEFRVLGPLEVLADGRPLRFRGELLPALLSLFLINANTVVSRDRLIDQLWNEQPPATANDSLNNMTSRLRKKIGPNLLETRATGYLLQLKPDQLDLLQFEQLLARQADEQEATARMRTLERALSLFRGMPFEDVLYAPFAQPTVRRIEELQLTAYEQLCELKLEAGDPDSALPLLQQLAARYPLRGRLRAQLVVALSRTGRDAEALASCHHYRQALAQLGIQPDAEIEMLARQISSSRPADLESARESARPGLGQRLPIFVAAT